MVKIGKLAYMRGGYVQFSPKMCRKLQPLILIYFAKIKWFKGRLHLLWVLTYVYYGPIEPKSM